MEMLTQWIIEHPVVTTWVTLISVFGVLVTVIALILQIADKKRRAIYYTITSTVLVDNEVSKIDGIKILFQNKEVATVVISNIKLWNGGNEILEEKDIYPTQKLKIVVPEGERILAATVIKETEDTCEVNVSPSKQNLNEAEVSFYCLEPKQGAIINVYHTNVNDDGTDVVGKIKDGKVINKSIEMMIKDGEICMSTGKHEIYFSSGIFRTGKNMIKIFYDFTGISVKKKERVGKHK